jgi:subtilase family serine protease
VIRRLSISLLTIIMIVSCATLVAQAQSQSLPTRHTREVTLNGQAPLVGHLPATQSMRLVLVLPHRNQTELDNLLKELYDPYSATYRKFLTVEEFTARFGPSQEDYDSVIRFAEANGFAVVGTSRNRMNLDVTGSVANIERAFHLTMGVYQHPTESRSFFAPDREPTADLAVQLWHITGLDNYSIPKPGFVRRDASAAQVKSNATTGSGPSASFLGSDMRAAYYVNGNASATLTGSGQSLGLFELAGTDLTDLTTYYTNVGQTNNVPITLLSVDTQSTSCKEHTCDDTEQTLDMTQALGMAPGLSSLVMYIGTGALSGQTVDDSGIFNAMATASPLNAQLSCSWQWTPSDPSTDNVYFEEFAAQGQNLFVDAGDDGKWSSSDFYWPTDSVYVTGVGGTDLETTGAGGAWSSETGWVDTGGGIGPDDFTIPSWQVAAAAGCAECSQSFRNGPDVAANADFSFYVCADQEACSANLYGGTSFATPMWAGYLALANEQYLSNGASTTLGFINPALYTIGLGSNYNTDFHDITSGGNTLGTTVGYDLSTGWGSPNGSALIDALAPASGPNFTISASPTAVSVAQGKSGTSTITTAVSGGFDSAVALSATGQPTGVTATFAPTSIAAPGSGTSTLTLAVASTTAPGKYTITVTGTGGSIKHTTTVTLTVTAAASFSMTASPTSVSVALGNSGTSTITTAVSGGFDSAIAFRATGQPTGVTATFSPTSIAAPGSGTSTLTLAVAATAKPGAYTITVTAKGGGITQTTTVTLTVTAAAPNFTISASPAAITVARGSTGTVTITTTIEGSFDSAITLSAPFECSPNPIAAPGAGTSTMTIAVGDSAALGAHTLTITGAGGGLKQTTTVILTVVE